MLPYGETTQEAIDELVPLLAEGDILIDGGNSPFQDDVRRGAELAGMGIPLPRRRHQRRRVGPRGGLLPDGRRRAHGLRAHPADPRDPGAPGLEHYLAHGPFDDDGPPDRIACVGEVEQNNRGSEVVGEKETRLVPLLCRAEEEPRMPLPSGAFPRPAR